MGEMQSGDPSRFYGYGRTVESRLVLEIAELLREECGVGIDAHSVGEGNEAGAVNRAYRAAACRILQMIVTPGDELPFGLTWVLRQAALRRLTESVVSEEQAENSIDSESGLGAIPFNISWVRSPQIFARSASSPR